MHFKIPIKTPNNEKKNKKRAKHNYFYYQRFLLDNLPITTSYTLLKPPTHGPLPENRCVKVEQAAHTPSSLDLGPALAQLIVPKSGRVKPANQNTRYGQQPISSEKSSFGIRQRKIVVVMDGSKTFIHRSNIYLIYLYVYI